VRERRYDFPLDEDGLTELIAAHDESEAVAALTVPVLLLHAQGDEVVPVEHSRALARRGPHVKLIAVPGGHHRSVQHDAELQGISLRFIARAADRARGEDGRVGAP
jgi:pimeloyl-ACP methyl ester carboxylesterase